MDKILDVGTGRARLLFGDVDADAPIAGIPIFVKDVIDVDPHRRFDFNVVGTVADDKAMGFQDVGERPSRCVMDGDSFAQVVVSARDGDGEAFAELYESMNRRILAFVSYRGAADPEGMVNDVFLKVFTNLRTFEGNEIQFAAWVFKIARNRLIDESRARRRRLDETSLDEPHQPLEAPVDVQSEALGRIGTQWVLEQLDALTPEQRDVVVMRVVSDLSIEAIAEVLGKRVGAVKAMQRRAFRALARNLGSEAVPKRPISTL